MTTQPTFNHPELVVRSLPKETWTFTKISENDHAGNLTLCYKSENNMKLLVRVKNAKIVEETFIDTYYRSLEGTMIAKVTYHEEGGRFEDYEPEPGCDGYWCSCKPFRYRRKISPSGDIEEEWRDDNGKITALRRSVNGKLSCEGFPAVFIQRPNNLRREEYWKDGSLERVFVIDNATGAKVVEQMWKDGAYQWQAVAVDRKGDIMKKDCEGDYRSPISGLPLEQETPPTKTFKLTSAQEAREEFSKDEEIIQNILENFETLRREDILSGNRRIRISAEPRFHEYLVTIFESAGYTVDNRFLGQEGSMCLWVSY